MGIDRRHGMNRAVFLDRDGVLNRNIWSPETGDFESPLTVEEFELLPNVIPALHLLQKAGFYLFLVSNQPNYVNGKASIEVLDAIHEKLTATLRESEIIFTAFYYCRHHPRYSGSCHCRKPSPYFLLQARYEFSLTLHESWMVGDRATDIACGQSAGTKTVFITNAEKPEVKADYQAVDLHSAAMLIITTTDSSADASS